MSPGQKTMIENNLGIIRNVVWRFVNDRAEIPDSWQYAVACQAVCEAVSANKWTPERGKFSTFVHSVARFAIINEWRNRNKIPLSVSFDDEENLELDVVIPTNCRVTLDIPYKDVFANGFDDKQKEDAEMFRRSLEGESITDLVKELGISRQSFYNRVKAIKETLAKHAVTIQ